MHPFVCVKKVASQVAVPLAALVVWSGAVTPWAAAYAPAATTASLTTVAIEPATWIAGLGSACATSSTREDCGRVVMAQYDALPKASRVAIARHVQAQYPALWAQVRERAREGMQVMGAGHPASLRAELLQDVLNHSSVPQRGAVAPWVIGAIVVSVVVVVGIMYFGIRAEQHQISNGRVDSQSPLP